MTDAENETLHDNLAFVRALVSEGGQVQASAGAAFLAGGLLYGAQCLLNWMQILGWLPGGAGPSLFVGIAPTVIFLIVICILFWRDRKNRQEGVATRALSAAFGSAGLANIFMVAVFGYNAVVEKSLTVWLFYPVVVCAFQGAVWYIAYMIRRKLWLAGVSAGWFASTLALGLLVHQVQWYILVLGAALLFIMGGSGYGLMRSARKRG
jgi:hypothetical protein